MKSQYFLFIIITTFIILSCAAKPKNADPSKIESPRPPQKTLDGQLNLLTDQIVTSLSQEKKSKIAVIEFSNLRGEVSQFGRYLAEELITRLYLTQKFEVIERQMLKQVLEEHKLNMSGLIDPRSAKELGRILGVDAIASGSVTDLGGSVKVNARLISTETGKIFSVASVTILKDKVVRKLMDETIAPQDDPADQPGEPPVAGKGSIPSLNMTDVVDDFKFELTGCQLDGRSVICDLFITNTTEDDRKITIWFLQTKIYDQSGNEYVVCKTEIANSSSRPNPDCQWNGSSRLEKTLISGVRTPSKLVFEKVSSAIQEVSLLKISLNRKGAAKFRNIPLR